MESKQYQFRANAELEAKIRSIWDPRMNTTDNLCWIIQKGVQLIQAERRRASGSNRTK